MGNQRLLLYFTLFFIIYMIWAQWQLAYGPKPEVVAGSDTVTVSAKNNENSMQCNEVWERIQNRENSGDRRGGMQVSISGYISVGCHCYS